MANKVGSHYEKFQRGLRALQEGGGWLGYRSCRSSPSRYVPAMHRIQFHHLVQQASDWRPRRNPLMDLLLAVASQGSISAAARTLALSYRYVGRACVGNRNWARTIVWEKGQSARLTEFGTKLLWGRAPGAGAAGTANRNPARRSERAFAVAFDPHAHVVTPLPATTMRRVPCANTH